MYIPLSNLVHRTIPFLKPGGSLGQSAQFKTICPRKESLFVSMSNERGTGAFVGPKEDDNDEAVSSSLLQKVWHGRLPAKVSLAAGESKSFTNTTPLYV